MRQNLILVCFCFQKAFDVFCDKEKVNCVIKTNLRAEKASVPEYLLSRSVAGNAPISSLGLWS
jgi:hypothetical protein